MRSDVEPRQLWPGERRAGRYYDFDAAGNAAEALQTPANLPLLANEPFPGLDTDKSSTVVDIGSGVRRERFMREHGWELTKHELDRIVADIWKRPIVAEKVKDLKGGASKTRKSPRGARRTRSV
jgi:hypothetical protein